MKPTLTIILLTFFIASQDSYDLKDESSVLKKHPKFLEGVKADNPEAQGEINKLKKEFYQEREKINQKYELRIKELKKNRKNEIDRLKKKYKQRMKRLRKKHPSIPKAVDVDPKPMPKLKPPKNTDRMRRIEQKKENRIEDQKRKDIRRENRYRLREEMRIKEELNKDTSPKSKASNDKGDNEK